MTLSFSSKLLKQGLGSGDDRGSEWANLTAAIVLAIFAAESFVSSLAFAMDQSPTFKINYRKFLGLKEFWPKVNFVCHAAKVPSDGSREPFKTLVEAQQWRNKLAHTTPYAVSSPAIENTTTAIHALHEPKKGTEYLHSVDAENATRFFEAARDFIKLLIDNTSLQPRAIAAYTLNGETLRIQRNTPLDGD